MPAELPGGEESAVAGDEGVCAVVIGDGDRVELAVGVHVGCELSDVVVVDVKSGVLRVRGVDVLDADQAGVVEDRGDVRWGGCGWFRGRRW